MEKQKTDIVIGRGEETKIRIYKVSEGIFR